MTKQEREIQNGVCVVFAVLNKKASKRKTHWKRRYLGKDLKELKQVTTWEKNVEAKGTAIVRVLK